MENQNNVTFEKEQKHEISIALVQLWYSIYQTKHCQSIGCTKLLQWIKLYRKDELKVKRARQIHKDIKDQLAKKVNNDDFDPIKKTLSGLIGW